MNSLFTISKSYGPWAQYVLNKNYIFISHSPTQYAVMNKTHFQDEPHLNCWFIELTFIILHLHLTIKIMKNLSLGVLFTY